MSLESTTTVSTEVRIFMATTIYQGQTISRDEVLEAMRRFDTDVRGDFRESLWRKYAVVHEGRRYPPKELMRLVINNREVGTGGYFMNSRYSNLGFSVINIEDPHEPLSGESAQDDTEYVPPTGDRREWAEGTIKLRRGQARFRNALRRRYGDFCMVTDCGILAVLEAAHINPHQSDEDHHQENGLILRADIHTLFDLDLLGIEPESLRIELHPDIRDEYGDAVRDRLRCPANRAPSSEALELKYARFRERCELPLN